MENAEARMDALRSWIEDQLQGMVYRCNQSLGRVGRDMREAFSRIEWLENEVKGLRRLLQELREQV